MNNLLITIGDSFTSGVGCYDPDLLIDYENGIIDNSEIYKLSEERFPHHAWPVHTAKILNFELLNLAKGGMSNISMAKNFLSNKYSDLRRKYDKVLVIVLLSYNNRLGFFRDGKPTSIIPSTDNKEESKLFEAYLKFILAGNSNPKNIEYYKDDKVSYLYRHDDGLYETAFSIRAIESFCKANSYDFYYGSFMEDIAPLKSFYYSDNNLHSFLKHKASRSIIELVEEDTSMFSFCSHLNESGYKIVGDTLGTLLDKIYIKRHIL